MIDIELLWFADCPNHAAARAMLEDVLRERAVRPAIRDIDATDPEVAARIRFPGSPTIRVNGVDVMPGFTDPGDYTPRCRVYPTASGLRGVPERSWVEAALDAALAGNPGASPFAADAGATATANKPK
jgi:hypothetical protein